MLLTDGANPIDRVTRLSTAQPVATAAPIETASAWVFQSVQFTATEREHLPAFQLSQPVRSFIGIDAVSIRMLGGPGMDPDTVTAPIPVPAAMPSLLAGLAVSAGWRWPGA